MKFELKQVPETVLLDAILNNGNLYVAIRFSRVEAEQTVWGFNGFIKEIKRKMFKALIEKQMGWTSGGYSYFCKGLGL